MFLRIKDLEIDNQLTILDRYLIVLKQIDKIPNLSNLI